MATADASEAIAKAIAGLAELAGLGALAEGRRIATNGELPQLGVAPARKTGPDGDERARQLAEARFRSLVEQIPAVTFVASLAGGENALYVSPQIEDLLGFTQNEWLSDPVLWYRQTHPEDRPRVSDKFARTCMTGEGFRDAFRVITKVGRIRWVQAEARFVRDDSGRLLFLQGVGFDITDQMDAQEARQQLVREQVARADADRERDRLRALFTRLPSATWLLRGPQHTIEFLNPIATELLDDAARASGLPFAEAVPQFAHALGDALDHLLRTGQVITVSELKISRPKWGRDRFFNVVCHRLEDHQGPLLLVHATEVTKEVTARDEMARAVRLRDEFVGVASHELRTPVTALLGHAQLALRRLERGVEGAALIPQIRAVEDSANRLSQLVGQLLDVSRLGAGKPMLKAQSTDVVALVRHAVEMIELFATGHEIVVRSPSALHMEADPLRVEQVLTNLLDNAVKYSPSGTEIRVDVSTSGPDVEIAVRDHGIGVPVERRGQLFDRFYQAHGATSRGLGLGLYISRQIALFHGGDLRAEFPADGGTRFVLRLPMKARPQEQASERTA
jgi:PAS domain S-box-containing protein